MTAGIIVEFNPFHVGHGVHIAKTREVAGDGVVVVMSGNFVQRGEPALCDKWRRTKMALLQGVDIVVEIPLPYVISGADYFARGSVQLLAAMGVVDVISFGSECGDLAALQAAGRVLAEEPEAYKAALQDGMRQGLSFAAAKGRALEAVLGEMPDGLLARPNNGLAMEYCKALHLLGNPLRVIATHRMAGGSSATRLRRAVHGGEFAGEDMPWECREILKEAIRLGEIAHIDQFSDILRSLIYSKDLTLGEGLENRFRKYVGEFRSITELLDAVKTKRYTYTRLQRIAMQVLLGVDNIDEYEAAGGMQYIRVLGFRRQATGLLGEMVKRANLPVITHGKAMDEILAAGGVAGKMLAAEFTAGDIYRIATGAPGGYHSERGVGVVVV
ncbi:MAG: nucleotidyltransferase family protein [Defluviitaleaceae bacterium]|nr:nucleotidyltransferase family protein [Defluviitaleaceae bacterium]